MVLQRQVPARSAAKAGEGFAGGNAADGSGNDAFSDALSLEKRSSAAERDKVAGHSKIDAEKEAAKSDDQRSSASEASDEIIKLLSGLKSSAAYAEDAELGKAGGGETQVPDPAIDVDAEPAIDEASTSAAEAAAADAQAAVPVVPVKETLAGMKPAATTDDAGTNQMQQDQASTGLPAAKPAAAAQTSQVNAEQASVGARSANTGAMTPPAAAQVAAATAGQAVAAQPKVPATANATEQQKDPSAVKEAMRALGINGEPAAANTDTGKSQSRGRNTGDQGGASDKRIDDLTGKKDGKIEVIESRRFVPAQNLSANGQLLTRSLAEAGSNALAAQRAAPMQPLAQAGLPQSAQTLHTLKLQLNPASLGSVTAVLKLSGEDLSVEIKVQTAEAYRQIKDDNQSILKALRGQGFGVEQITVQHVVGNDRSSAQTAQPGFQSGQHQPGSSDAQSSGRDGSRNNAGQQDSGSQGGQARDQGSYAGSGAGRTDGVYL
jgi:chemotaxis protein MotD